ncbi:MAG: 50S ribosomal protein L35ae [Methanocellales archaeon]
MEGVVVNYRSGRHTQRRNQCLVKIAGVKDKYQASKFIGKKIVWSSSKGKRIKGKIISTHGSNGFVLAAFEKCLPQSGERVIFVD